MAIRPEIQKRLLRAPQVARQRKAELLGILQGLRIARRGDTEAIRTFLEDSREIRNDPIARAIQAAFRHHGSEISLIRILDAAQHEESRARLDRDRPITFHRRSFCFTGEFSILGRTEAEQLTEELGGRVVGFPSGNTDYLVKGSRRSPTWSYHDRGRKIEWLERMQNIVKCRLVEEDQWTRAVVHELERSDRKHPTT